LFAFGEHLEQFYIICHECEIATKVVFMNNCNQPLQFDVGHLVAST
jgi:hypothetical protein